MRLYREQLLRVWSPPSKVLSRYCGKRGALDYPYATGLTILYVFQCGPFCWDNVRLFVVLVTYPRLPGLVP